MIMMKKLLICLLAVVLLGCLPVSADNGGIEDDWGDILVKRHVLRTFTLSEKGFRGADVTGDGKVNAMDYVLIKRVVMGTADFPCLHEYTEEVVGNMHVFTCGLCGYQYKTFDGQLIG